MFRSGKKRGYVLLGGILAAIITMVVLQRRRSETLSTPLPAPVAGATYRQSLFRKLYCQLAQTVDQKVGWDRLPLLPALLVLSGLRIILRQHNLHDTSSIPAVNLPPVETLEARYLVARSPDGSYNDLKHPRMGMAGSRFGRNIPLEHTYPESPRTILTPSPRIVSRELLTRKSFQPATTLNSLAAAWIQFMVRDWLAHPRGDKQNYWSIPLQPDDPWRHIQDPMRIIRIPEDPTRGPQSRNLPPTFINTETHWWDGSQIYGSNAESQMRVRSGKDGKLRITAKRLLPFPADPALDPRHVPGWWIGLEMMTTLFALEHNAICAHLRDEYPTWSDDEIFDRARLINAALLAKIHTVEWTPAIINHPTMRVAMRANWWGLAMERLSNVFGRLSPSESISGIPGSPTDHFGVPYAMTEEFVAVYRMHPLIRDEFTFRSVSDGRLLQENTLAQLTGLQTEAIVNNIPMEDLFYSFGTLHPGALVLHNFPRFLQEFTRPDGIQVDLAATDILRMRELGVPRYNDLRELLHLPVYQTFEELTSNPVEAETLRAVYQNDINRVDLMVGMFAERRPQGFAFSETAFRVFILMASRRLNSDRFFTTDFTPQVYTPMGMDWIKNNTMLTILQRHYPQLGPSLRGIENAFVPWAEIP